MKNSIALILFFLTISVGDLYSQSELTLADIYKNGTYRQNRFGPIRWMKDGLGYSSIEKSNTLEGDEIVRYDAAKGNRSVLVSAGELIPEGESKPLTVADYHWSENNSKLLIFTNTRKVWRYHTR
jgi:dipeptidyl-peptidase-4